MKLSSNGWIQYVCRSLFLLPIVPYFVFSDAGCGQIKIFGRHNKARMYFAQNATKVPDVDLKILRERIVAPILKQIHYIDEVIVVGHSSSVGEADYNLKLSKQRAQMFRKALIKEGLPPPLVSTRGMGDTQLMYLGENAEDHARNRRVEFIVNFKEECL